MADPLKGSIFSLFLKYALPSALGMLAVSSSAIVDGIFVGNYVGSEALAAVNFAMPVFTIILGLNLMISVGGSVIAGKQIGEGKTLQAKQTFMASVGCTLAITLFMGLIALVALDSVVVALGAEGRSALLLEEYLNVVLLFSPFIGLGTSLMFFVRVDNNPYLMGTANLLNALTNIGLDYLFIVQLDMGIFGAALATGLAQLLAMLVLLLHFIKKERVLGLTRPVNVWPTLKTACFNGSSEFGNEVSAGVTALIFNWVLMSRVGVDGVAAFAVINYLCFIGIILSFGVSDSLTPVISKNYGAKNPRRISAFITVASVSVFLIGLSVSIALIFFPLTLIRLFLDNASNEAITIAMDFAKYIWPAFLMNGINIVLSGYLTAMHQPMPSLTISLLRSFLLPASLLMLLPIWFEQLGIYLVPMISELVTFVVALILYKKYAPHRLIERDAP